MELAFTPTSFILDVAVATDAGIPTSIRNGVIINPDPPPAMPLSTLAPRLTKKATINNTGPEISAMKPIFHENIMTTLKALPLSHNKHKPAACK
jgi:hypothetical protein